MDDERINTNEEFETESSKIESDASDSECDTSEIKFVEFDSVIEQENKTYASKSDLPTYHTPVHIKIKAYKCSVCSQIIYNRDKLEEHKSSHIISHRCHCCGKGFRKIENLKYYCHLKGANAEPPNILCNFCDKNCKRSPFHDIRLETLNVIELDETENIPIKEDVGEHVCEICNKSYKTKTLLKEHLKCHKEKNFFCNTCKKKFATEQHLNRHQGVHTGERPFECTECGQAFIQSSHLHQHMLIHTGEKPHQCELCNKRFGLSHNLKVHMRTHTGEKPYKCETCNKSFSQSSILNSHMRTHTGETPYSCTKCGKSFTRKYGLTIHNCLK